VNEEIFETPSSSPNFQTELAAQLAELVPEAVADGKIDVLKLQELLANDAADSSERFGLFWPGKQRSLRVAQMPTTSTLRPEPEKSRAWDTTKNVFIEGDNLEVLKILQKHYHGKIKLIYIDPPYNTGKDFVYPDNFKEGLDNYLDWSRQVSEDGKKLSTNSETDGRYHSTWLSMMYPRIKLARNLLTDDGTIFVSISDHEVDNLRKILNEVFGESNFVGQIAVSKGTTTGQDANDIGSSIDFLLVFARNKTNYIPNGLPLSEDDIARFNQQDEKGLYSVLQFRKTGNGDRREDRPNLYYPIVAPDGSEVFPIGPGGYQSRWRAAREQYELWVDQDMIQWKLDSDGAYKPYVKYYLEGRTKQVSNYWDDIEGNKKASLTIKNLIGKNVFTNPKPVGLIKKIIGIAADQESLILDFFAGSATTAHAVLEMNQADGGSRRFILVQLPEPTPDESEARKAGYKNIADISRARVTKVAEGIEAENSTQLKTMGSEADLGFRSYRLVDSNFKKWQANSDIDSSSLEQHLFSLRDNAADEAKARDLLVEILLKQGLSLSESSSTVSISGFEVLSVADGVLMAYLDEKQKPPLEFFRKIVDTSPARLVVLEDAFKGDDELKTNLAQLCRSKNIELWTA
jgi:adenine-specific DNA-methyltransferase